MDIISLVFSADLPVFLSHVQCFLDQHWTMASESHQKDRQSAVPLPIHCQVDSKIRLHLLNLDSS
jgi:hypothetical protein